MSVAQDAPTALGLVDLIKDAIATISGRTSAKWHSFCEPKAIASGLLLGC